jgi:glutamyl-tRNA synthetase
VCTRSELRSVVNAPHAEDAEPRYPGTCRARFDGVAAAEASSQRSAGLRFAVPTGTLTLEDGCAGTLSSDVQAEVGDFMILRRDKLPAYQLAVVVDDAADGVTHVLRGSDLLASTARQWHLQHALGLPHPSWYHVPLVCDEAGRRLAKRRDDLSLSELRAGGSDPRRIVAWAAGSAGQRVPERVTATEVLRVFELGRLGRENTLLGALELARLRAP